MNLAASASFRAAAELGEPEWDEAEPELPDGYESWEAFYRDQLDGPTEADYAALDRAYAARDAAEPPQPTRVLHGLPARLGSAILGADDDARAAGLTPDDDGWNDAIESAFVRRMRG